MDNFFRNWNIESPTNRSFRGDISIFRATSSIGASGNILSTTGVSKSFTSTAVDLTGASLKIDFDLSDGSSGKIEISLEEEISSGEDVDQDNSKVISVTASGRYKDAERTRFLRITLSPNVPTTSSNIGSNFIYGGSITVQQRSILQERYRFAYTRVNSCSTLTPVQKKALQIAFTRQITTDTTTAEAKGEADVGGSRISLNFNYLNLADEADVAQTLIHELMHCVGYTHPDRDDDEDIPGDGGAYFGTPPLQAEICIAGRQNDDVCEYIDGRCVIRLSNTVTPDNYTPSVEELRQRNKEVKRIRNITRNFSYEEFIVDSPETNQDEQRFIDLGLPGFAAFTKSLEHDDETGLVSDVSFQSLLKAINIGTQDAFENVILGGISAVPAKDCNEIAPRRLANPLNSYSFQLIGNDSNGARMSPAPSFSSRNTAVDMVERYWMSLCRDVPFTQYSSSPLIKEACDDLNDLGFKEEFGFECKAETIFRGPYTGCFDGPHVSQFLLQDFDFGNQPVVQQQRYPQPGLDFMTDLQTWLKINNGEVDPTGEDVLVGTRYINTLRDAGQWVHVDFPHQSSLWAMINLLRKIMANPSLAIKYANCPTETRDFEDLITTSDAFGSLGPPDLTIISGLAAVYGLKHAWFQKWRVHRRLRPEVYAQRLELFRLGEFAESRFIELFGEGSEVWIGKKRTSVLERIREHNKLQNLRFGRNGSNRQDSNNGTYLLPMAFPEGSPTHPSYPGGHSAFIAAGATIAKAFFKDSVISSPQVPNSNGSELEFIVDNSVLTVHGELNKLIANVTLFRDGAGMHWRTDGTTSGKGGIVPGTDTATGGNLLGEKLAISMLRDIRVTYLEMLDKFEFDSITGEPISITNNLPPTADDD